MRDFDCLIRLVGSYLTKRIGGCKKRGLWGVVLSSVSLLWITASSGFWKGQEVLSGVSHLKNMSLLKINNKKNPTKGWQPLGVCKAWVSDVAAVTCKHFNCHRSILLVFNCYSQLQTVAKTLFTVIPPQIQKTLDRKNTSVVGEGRKGDTEWLSLWAAWAEEQLSWKVFKLPLAFFAYTSL